MSCQVDWCQCDISHYIHRSPPTASPFCQAIRLNVTATKAEIVQAGLKLENLDIS